MWLLCAAATSFLFYYYRFPSFARNSSGVKTSGLVGIRQLSIYASSQCLIIRIFSDLSLAMYYVAISVFSLQMSRIAVRIGSGIGGSAAGGSSKRELFRL